jgi:antitoxin component of MazEF toxin-antitoxin module
MPYSTVTDEGSTKLPREVVQALSIHPGDQIAWEIRGNLTVICRVDPTRHAGEQLDVSGP